MGKKFNRYRRYVDSIFGITTTALEEHRERSGVQLEFIKDIQHARERDTLRVEDLAERMKALEMQVKLDARAISSGRIDEQRIKDLETQMYSKKTDDRIDEWADLSVTLERTVSDMSGDIENFDRRLQKLSDRISTVEGSSEVNEKHQIDFAIEFDEKFNAIKDTLEEALRVQLTPKQFESLVTELWPKITTVGREIPLRSDSRLKASCNSLSIRVLELEKENKELKAYVAEKFQEQVDELSEDFREGAQPIVDEVKRVLGYD